MKRLLWPANRRRQLMLRWAAPLALVTTGLAAVVVAMSGRVDPAALPADGSVAGLTSVLSRAVAADQVTIAFEEIGAAAGLAFRHFPARRASLLPEDMGSGLAWGDYDSDGDDDLYLVNFSGSITEDGAAAGSGALYRNDGGTFTDVTMSSGLDAHPFGMGASWGDVDNDGDLDLVTTAYGPNQLWRNDGDGTFTDITAAAGVGDDRFGAGCAWGDFDRNGWIDLYVCNYVAFDRSIAEARHPSRQYGTEVPFTLNPSSFDPQSNGLYRNNGDGTFSDVAEAAGVADPGGRSLAAAWFDMDGDGWTDLYVANDVSANGVFRNRGDGTFEDIGASSLAADYRGAMGLGVADHDRDGDLDLFVTHWVAQENAMFQNMVSAQWPGAEGRPRLFFMDNADVLGLGQISLNMVGWATGFADFDNDGWLDLWVVNGHTFEQVEDPARLRPQRMQIFRQLPGKGFFEMAERACPALAAPIVGRGGAQADFDGDGRVDLAVMAHGGAPLLLRNTAARPGHFVTIRLRQRGGNTMALGARVTLRAGGQVQLAEVGAGGSYLSQHAHDLHFGLGDAASVDELTIRWPDGTVQTERRLAADRVASFEHVARDPVRPR